MLVGSQPRQALTLELVARTELQVARNVSCRCGTDDAEGRVFIPEVGKREARRVGEVEQIDVEFQLAFVRQCLGLHERHVEVSNAVAANVGEIARRIARLLIAGVGKAVGVQVWLLR